MIEMGRSEKIIKEMDQLASEDHTHNATRAEINVYRGNWWIHSNVVNFDSVPTRHQPDFKKAFSTMYRLKQAETRSNMQNGHKVLLFFVAMANKLVGVRTMSTHHKDGVTTD